MELEEIKNIVKETLSEKRFNHSVCVMNKCEELAILYDVDVELAKLVGITHDIAKEMTKTETMDYVQKNGIISNELEKEIPSLLHGKIGADICKKKFGFTDQMAKAIEAHTTGKADMDKLAKILYIADAISDDRKDLYVDKVRELSKQSLDKAILYLLDSILKEKLKNKEKIHLDGVATRNAILSNKK